MPKKTKAVYDVTTTFGMHRDMIFTLNAEIGKNYIQVVNSRTGEFHQIPHQKEFQEDFLYKCEIFIIEHFGKHLCCFKRKLYQKGEE